MASQEQISALTRHLGLQRLPVGVCWGHGPAPTPPPGDAADACDALLRASQGQSTILSAGSPSCRVGLYHLGLSGLSEEEKRLAFEQFVFDARRSACFVEEIPGMDPTALRARALGEYLIVGPLHTIDEAADVIVFICTLDQAAKLLALDGGAGATALELRGPLCQRAVVYPLVADRLNVTLLTDAGRRLHGYRPDELLVSVPPTCLERIVGNLPQLAEVRAQAEIADDVLSLLRERCSGHDN